MDYRITNIGKLHVNRRVPLLLILFVTIVSFLPSLTNGFQMEWDDQWMVVNSQTVGRLSRYLLLSMFTVPSHGQIAPINQLLYTFLYRCFGFNPMAYHLACLVLHIFMSVFCIQDCAYSCTTAPLFRHDEPNISSSSPHCCLLSIPFRWRVWYGLAHPRYLFPLFSILPEASC